MFRGQPNADCVQESARFTAFGPKPGFTIRKVSLPVESMAASSIARFQATAIPTCFEGQRAGDCVVGAENGLVLAIGLEAGIHAFRSAEILILEERQSGRNHTTCEVCAAGAVAGAIPLVRSKLMLARSAVSSA